MYTASIDCRQVEDGDGNRKTFQDADIAYGYIVRHLRTRPVGTVAMVYGPDDREVMAFRNRRLDGEIVTVAKARNYEVSPYTLR